MKVVCRMLNWKLIVFRIMIFKIFSFLKIFLILINIENMKIFILSFLEKYFKNFLY